VASQFAFSPWWVTEKQLGNVLWHHRLRQHWPLVLSWSLSQNTTQTPTEWPIRCSLSFYMHVFVPPPILGHSLKTARGDEWRAASRSFTMQKFPQAWCVALSSCVCCDSYIMLQRPETSFFFLARVYMHPIPFQIWWCNCKTWNTLNLPPSVRSNFKNF
jgi:hypothetical protein